MSTTAEAVARVKSDMEQALGMMRTQMAAFRRLAAPEVMAGYPRITAIIGRQDFLVSGRRSKAGLQELLDEAELLAWDVPNLLKDLFTEAWMQQCFVANDTYADTTAYHIYDYLRGRGRPESPFPAHFAETLNRAFHPLGRLLKRSGFDVGSGDLNDPRAFPRMTVHYRMNPAMTAGSTLFGEQARRSYELREQLKKLELKLAEEQSRALWDEIEAERKKKAADRK
ncbi:MAG TPA: hypothetical protein VG838_10630 [Opitutaceae bacterium]|nr:hypothetical protein [Opitutaceae bacterium]